MMYGWLWAQVNGVRTKDLDCCQVVPLIVQATGREAHFVISRNPLVWSTSDSITPCSQAGSTAPVSSQPPTDIHACPPLIDGDRGIARWPRHLVLLIYLFLPVGTGCLLGREPRMSKEVNGEDGQISTWSSCVLSWSSQPRVHAGA